MEITPNVINVLQKAMRDRDAQGRDRHLMTQAEIGVRCLSTKERQKGQPPQKAKEHPLGKPHWFEKNAIALSCGQVRSPLSF